MGYSTIYKPWELHRSLRSGCHILVPAFTSTSHTAEEKIVIMTAFTKAAWLDKSYLPLAQAAVLFANKSANLGDLQSNDTYKAAALLYGFCLTPP